MDVSEIVDGASFQRWLEALPQGSDAERAEARRWAVLLAHRAAMRVLPEFWAWRLTTPPRKGGFTALTVLRLSEMGGVAGKYPTSLIQHATVAAANADPYAAFTAEGAASAAYAAADAAKPDAPHVIVASCAAGGAGYAAEDSPDAAATWNALRVDCTALLAGADPYLLPLWPDENPLAAQWATIRTHPSTQSPGWRFWIDWYDRALTGQPQDWALLEKVALIDPEDWDKGEDHVNALILQMVEQHSLLLETRRLKAENQRLAEQLRALEHRSHNHPPELVQDLNPIKTGTTVIWAALADAERELAKPKPDRGALRRAAEALLNGATAFGKYCLTLGDIALQSAAKVGGAALVGGLVAYRDEVLSLAQNLVRFLGSFL